MISESALSGSRAAGQDRWPCGREADFGTRPGVPPMASPDHCADDGISMTIRCQDDASLGATSHDRFSRCSQRASPVRGPGSIRPSPLGFSRECAGCAGGAPGPWSAAGEAGTLVGLGAALAALDGAGGGHPQCAAQGGVGGLGGTRLPITADAGGAGGYRTRAWKTGLAALATETCWPGCSVSTAAPSPGWFTKSSRCRPNAVMRSRRGRPGSALLPAWPCPWRQPRTKPRSNQQVDSLRSLGRGSSRDQRRWSTPGCLKPVNVSPRSCGSGKDERTAQGAFLHQRSHKRPRPLSFHEERPEHSTHLAPVSESCHGRPAWLFGIRVIGAFQGSGRGTLPEAGWFPNRLLSEPPAFSPSTSRRKTAAADFHALPAGHISCTVQNASGLAQPIGCSSGAARAKVS
jgi:hypothetical protein